MKTNIKKLMGVSMLLLFCYCNQAQIGRPIGIGSSGGAGTDPCNPQTCYPFQNLDLLQVYSMDAQILNAVSGGSTGATLRQGTQDSILVQLNNIDANTGNLNTTTTNTFSYSYINTSGVHTYTYGTYFAISVQNIGTSNAQFDGSVLPPGASVTIPYSRNRLPKTVSLNALTSTLLVLVQ